MSAIILGWNPDRWNEWNYAAVVERVNSTGLQLEPWSVGRHRDIVRGTDAWLLLQRDHGRGLIGHGVVVSDAPELGPHYADPGKTAMYVDVAFDSLLPLGDQIGTDVLVPAVPGIPWGSVRGSGLAIDPADEAGIRSVWAEFGPAPGPDPTQLVPGTYPDEAVTRATVNRYEKDPEARRACIAHRGISCAACGFSFEQAYGEIGKDFIDVHHVVPAAQLGGGYQLDPLTDLVPLCANCHAMAHHGVSTPRTEAELRQLIANAGFLSGTVVTPEQLEAERAAREILGPG